MRHDALKRITKIDCTTKEYRDTSCVELGHQVMNILGRISDENLYLEEFGIKVPDITQVVFADNRAKLRRLFGLASCHFMSEFDYHVYRMIYRSKDYGHKLYDVVTAKIKGTTISARSYHSDLDIEFVIDLYRILA